MQKKGALLLKRFFDIIVSLCGIIVLSPLLLVISILIKVNLGSPIFFVQERIGKGNKKFKLIKFRTMRDLKDKDGNEKEDKYRMTKLGSILRALSIDELPELINILKGDMSLIGPRPLLVEYLPFYSKEQIRRHDVLPGLTGFAQINGRNNISWEKRFEFDLYYVDNWSLNLDIKIFLKTIFKVLKREGVSKEGEVTMDRFSGNNNVENKEIKDIVIIGAGGFGREIVWLISSINKDKRLWNLIGFIDEDESKIGKIINGYKVLGNLEYFKDNRNIYYVCAIGNAKSRKEVVEKCREYKIKAATLIDPSVKMDKESCSIGEGSIICAGNILTTNINIKDHIIINLSCTIGHDVVIEDFVTIYPGVNVSGNCNLGSCSELGTGSKIIEGKSIGSNSIIGAGTVVIRGIKDNCTAVGVPAKIIKDKDRMEN